MIKQRLISGILLIIAAYVIFVLGDKYVFCLGATGLSLLGLYEWRQFLPSNSLLKKVSFLGIGAAALIAICSTTLISINYLNLLLPIVFFALAWWIIAILLVATFPKFTDVLLNDFISAILGILTLSAFLIAFLLMRFYSYKTAGSGLSVLFYVLCLVWATDICAYGTGKMYGKHKLIKAVSPGKTIEGLIGGIIGAILISQIFLTLAPHNSPLLLISKSELSLITIVTILFSILGDLVESMFKRLANIKDSSKLIPGHGGVLDRIDSLLSAIPVFFLLFLAFLK